MMEKLIVTTLVVNAILVILGKYHVIERIQLNAPYKIIHLWSKCEFCVFNAFAVPVCIPVLMYFGFEWIDLTLPIMAASLKQMLS